MLKIVQSPATVLNTAAEAVTQFDSAIQTLVQEMEETLLAQTDPEGVGLAAPQVGISKAIFIMKSAPEAKTEICINPHIVASEESPNPTSKPKKNTPLEGCLSIPRIWSPVKRAKRVQLAYQDTKGKKITKWYSGFKATIVQHEVDHLQGVLFTQRALEQKTPLYEEKKKGKLEKLDY